MLHILLALLVNAVPIYGVIELGWSASTVLVLFWLENLLGALINGARIALHARWSRKRGHYDYVAPDHSSKAGAVPKAATPKRARPTSYLSGFLVMTLVFTLAHGIFVGVITLMMNVNRCAESAIWCFDFEAFKLGAAGVAAFLVLDLLIDLPGLSKRSFLWIERVSGSKLARVLVLHLGIIFGFGAMAAWDTPASMLMVLMGLKALIDALTAWGAAQPPAPVDAPPPAWLKKLAPVGRDGERVEDFWVKSSKRDAERLARNEEIVS